MGSSVGSKGDQRWEADCQRCSAVGLGMRLGDRSWNNRKEEKVCLQSTLFSGVCDLCVSLGVSSGVLLC